VSGRTIVIGDVHGCLKELDELLQRVGPTSSDQLVFVGDLVARGPKSASVLGLVRSLGARAVLGNHERHVLGLRAELMERADGAADMRRSHPLLNELSPDDFTWLERLPLVIDLPEHRARVVHAGVVPNVPIGRQDPYLLTHLRTITADGKPSTERGHRLWGEMYESEPHVIFGHNALDGLQIHPHATGLDTGCVYGGELSALVLLHAGPVPSPAERRDAIVAVRAKKQYFVPKKRRSV
jgi:hypothetical protein